MKNRILILSFMTALLFLGNACQENELTDGAPDEIKTEGNYLVFPSEKLFNETIEELANKDRVFLSHWEKRYNFRSLRSLYNEVMFPMEQLGRESDAIGEDELYDHIHSNEDNKYKDLYTAHLRLRDQSKDVIIETENNGFEMDVISDSYSYIVNRDGLVKIKGRIYQFKKNYVKIIMDGDPSLIPQLVRTNASTDKIYVTEVTRDVRSYSNGKLNSTVTVNCQNEASVGGRNYRVNGQDQVIKWADPDAQMLQLVFYVFSQRKTLGLWISYNTTMTISGEYRRVHGPTYSNEITAYVSGTSSGNSSGYSHTYNFTFPNGTPPEDHFEISYTNISHSTPNVSCSIENWYLIVGS